MSEISQLSKLAISIAVCITASVTPTTSPAPQHQHFLLADTFMTKARFYHFFQHQTQSKRDDNVCENAWRTLFTVSPVLDMIAHSSTQEVGRGGGLAVSN